ncbi:MAG: pyridine nucleotide-disulfide oxidoreductase [Hyphomicrobiaceae bacterium]
MHSLADARLEPILLNEPREAQPQQARARTATRATGQRSAKVNKRRSEMPRYLLTLLAIVGGGYLLRDRHLIDPENGIGYALGIVAGSMLLLVLLYPLRKRAGSAGWLGRVSGWFRLHMLLGLLAPTLVLLHCNFQGGALNSNVALFALLTVAASGLVGRYLYGRIHRGLYGAKARASDLVGEALRIRESLDPGQGHAPELWNALRQHEQQALQMPRSTLGRMWHAEVTRRRSRALERRLVKDCYGVVDQRARLQGWRRREVAARKAYVTNHVRAYFRTVDRASSLAVFERLFAAWHVLHVPLFIVLIGAVIMHIIAVHLY